MLYDTILNEKPHAGWVCGNQTVLKRLFSPPRPMRSGLKLDVDGWTPVKDLLKALRRQRPEWKYLCELADYIPPEFIGE